MPDSKAGCIEKDALNTIGTFALWEKIYCQFTFNAAVIIAAYGLFTTNPGLGIAYFLYAYVSITLLVRYTVCPRCPHLHVANDCVNLPPAVMKKIVSPKRKGPLLIQEKAIFILALYGTFILPLYWLTSKPVILTTYLLLYGGHLLALRIHFCPNCANRACIQNRYKHQS